jgi:DNA adenine methylase
VDPPYWGNERDYGDGLFGRDDFARLAELLGRVKGKFILSLNDVPACATPSPTSRSSACRRGTRSAPKANQAVGEVLITNY